MSSVLRIVEMRHLRTYFHSGIAYANGSKIACHTWSPGGHAFPCVRTHDLRTNKETRLPITGSRDFFNHPERVNGSSTVHA
jgi:hypothetical protein